MPRKDPTPNDEVDEAIRENIRRGLMIETAPGHYSLTPEGFKAAERLIARLPRDQTP